MFSVGEVEVKGLQQFENMLGALGEDAHKAVGRAISRTGDMARTQVVRTLAKQTGLPQKTIRKSIKVKRPVFGSKTGKGQDLTYTLKSAGGDVALKYFQKRETKRGVVANLGAARGRVLFERTFFRGGAFPRRVDLSAFGGHVMDRVSEQRFHLRKVKSGVFIPEEMVDGATAAAFERSVEQNLPRRLDHEISRLLGL
ncbi:phage tail protein [Leisingera sp. HS039]|uniref:phage tail protein n=1 Tax=Leisingera sp. HS039 TaxID=2818496 RepID=UPI001B3A0BDD|nr:phage tail protein [Leisingera sp. HS039]MBQ4826569.1 phage tail protein [Leisingera sp. HS039]